MSQTGIYISATTPSLLQPRYHREGQEVSMGSRVLVYANAVQEMESVLQAVKALPDVEVVGVVQDVSNITIGVKKFTPDVLLIRSDTYSTAILDMTSGLRTDNALSGIVAIVSGTVDNAGVISLLKSGVNAIISVDASAEDLGIAIREASGNRLFIPPRGRDGR